jgi:hypothetical protein
MSESAIMRLSRIRELLFPLYPFDLSISIGAYRLLETGDPIPI